MHLPRLEHPLVTGVKAQAAPAVQISVIFLLGHLWSCEHFLRGKRGVSDGHYIPYLGLGQIFGI
jgi:hypothetical protein